MPIKPFILILSNSALIWPHFWNSERERKYNEKNSKNVTSVQMCCVQMCCKSRRSKSIEIDIGNQSISIDLIRRLISEIDRNRSQKKIIYRLLSIFVIVNDNKRSSNPEVNILNMTIFDFSN